MRRQIQEPIGHKPRGRPKLNGKANGKSNGQAQEPAAPPRRHKRRLSPTALQWLEEVSRRRAAVRKSSMNEPIYAEMVFRLRLLGATAVMIADALGVSEQTINNWTGRGNPRFIRPEYRAAYDAGGELADAAVAHSLFYRANGYQHPDTRIVNAGDGRVIEVPVTRHYPPDTEAAKFWLTNRHAGRWRNRSSQELSGSDGQPLLPPTLVLKALEAPKAEETEDS